MRFIIRPNCIRTTPRRLRVALGARRTIPVASVVSADYEQDLFLAYPSPDLVQNAPAGYNDVFTFYYSHKLGQRRRLRELGLSTVPVDVEIPGVRYVVRPLRHTQGQNYRVTASPTDYDSRREYSSVLINKEKEYRILYYKGQRVATYLKTNPNFIGNHLPWTFHNGCRFVTIYNPQNDPLLARNFYEPLRNCELIKTASLVAVDVLYGSPSGQTENDFYISEFNLCPGLSIPGTIQSIVVLENAPIAVAA